MFLFGPPNVKAMITKQDVRGLIEALGNKKYGHVRAAAAEGLGKLRDSRAIGPLIAALKDKDYFVRTAAVTALGELKDAQAQEPLIAALEDWSAEVRIASVKALTELKDIRAVDPLIAVLRDKDHRVKTEAARALGSLGIDLKRIKSTEERKFVRQTLETDKMEREQEEEARRRIRERAEVVDESKKEHSEENYGVLVLDNYWGNDQDGTTYKSCGTCGSKARYSMGMGTSNDHLYKIGQRCPQCGTLFTKERQIDH